MSTLVALQQELQQKYPWVKEFRVPSESASPLRMQIVVSTYQIEQNAALLEDIGRWSQQQKTAVAPYLLTEAEAKQLETLGEGAQTSLSPRAMLRHLLAQPEAPSNARAHVTRVIEELRRVLWNIELEFPTNGLHSWNIGLRLEVLFQQTVAWGLALFDIESTDPAEEWSLFVSKLAPYYPALAHPTLAHLPLLLKAFLQRHQNLVPVMPQTLNENDIELEQLTTPLEYAIRAMRHCVQAKLTTPEERERVVSIAFWGTMVLSSVCILGLLLLQLVTRIPTHEAIQLPPNAKPGGITGAYYSGRNFETLVRKRIDSTLYMRWPFSPIAGVPADHFSVRWDGYLQAPQTGPYQLCIQYDDGMRASLNGQSFINDWTGGHARSKCSFFHLQKGWHRLNIDLFEFNGPSSIHLTWRPPSTTSPRTVPAKRLCCR